MRFIRFIGFIRFIILRFIMFYLLQRWFKMWDYLLYSYEFRIYTISYLYDFIEFQS